jgi:hypothetical protein
VERLFAKYEPAQRGKGPMLLKKNRGKEEKLISALVKKYGGGAEPDPSEILDIPTSSLQPLIDDEKEASSTNEGELLSTPNP